MASGITVRAVVVSRFALDGGAMHGIVPRTLWSRVHPPDELNRIALVARAVVVDNEKAGTRALIETGMGRRWSDKERGIYGLEDGGEATEELAKAGVDPESITHVVLTHLHWDHAGGVVLTDGSLAFPRAEHVVGEESWKHAMAPGAKDKGSFRAGDLAALQGGKLRVAKGGERLAPGVDARVVNGHTEGQLVPIVRERDDGPPVAMPTDLIPTRSHLKVGWVMAYDNHPGVTCEEKAELIKELEALGGGIVLYHDPLVEAAWVKNGQLEPGRLGGELLS